MNFFSLFRRKPAPRAQATVAANSPDEPLETIILKTLVIVYNPIVEPSTGKRLSEFMRWNAVEDLGRGFMSDILQASGGLVHYQIIERIDVNAFPVKVDGRAYDAESYLSVLRGDAPPLAPAEANYYAILKDFNILSRVAKNEIDEVWIFNFPHAGFYESIMGGPSAFWCNAPPLQRTDAAKRRFIIMGFSYERGVGEMLENMGHRAESIMEKTFEKVPTEANLWRRFIRYDKTSPGKAALGNVHFAPNSVRDYDWNNPAAVMSECDDWFHNFPDFKGIRREVSANEWGNGDIRKHHVWWLTHFPKTKGRLNGVSNNWWRYIADPNNVSA
ncbi:MAG: hypothetical protein HKUEN02_08330 [Anaerolineaceae bacterium]|nr:MAG: hypothetical protein HKUEN02_08330 [Anaerolineaceae bacterium]